MKYDKQAFMFNLTLQIIELILQYVSQSPTDDLREEDEMFYLLHQVTIFGN